MPTVDEVLKLARQLTTKQQQEVARALIGPRAGRELPLAALPSRPAPHSVAWVKAERGHAVLATAAAASEKSLPAGWMALAGIWSDHPGLSEPVPKGEK